MWSSNYAWGMRGDWWGFPACMMCVKWQAGRSTLPNALLHMALIWNCTWFCFLLMIFFLLATRLVFPSTLFCAWHDWAGNEIQIWSSVCQRKEKKTRLSAAQVCTVCISRTQLESTVLTPSSQAWRVIDGPLGKTNRNSWNFLWGRAKLALWLLREPCPSETKQLSNCLTKTMAWFQLNLQNAYSTRSILSGEAMLQVGY